MLFGKEPHNMTLIGITLVGAIANLFGSLIAYYVGLRVEGHYLKNMVKYIFISHNKLELADRWFDKYGHEAVLISRITSRYQNFHILPAGIAHMDIKKFVIYTFIGSIPWCFALGYIGVLLGPQWELIKTYFHILDIIVAIGIVAFVAYLIYKYGIKPSINQKNQNAYLLILP